MHFNAYVLPQLENTQTHSKKRVRIIHTKMVVHGGDGESGSEVWG